MRKISLLLLLFLVACSSAPETATPPPSEGAFFTGIDLSSLGDYHVSYQLSFEGETSWLYLLETRRSGQTVERLLHIEAAEGASNPGDIRMVSEGGVSRMRGPGTEDECLQFPTGFDLGPVFLNPDDLVNPDIIAPLFTAQFEETIAGVPTTRYSFRRGDLNDWQDIQIDIWWDDVLSAVLRYDLQLTGNDPFFEAGEGRLLGRFEVQAIGPQNIIPVEGCDLSIPIPETATNLVKLPGLIAFESSAPIVELVTYFLETLPAQGWETMTDPLEEGSAILLTYVKDEKALRINIEQHDTGVTVEMFIGE